MPSVRGYRCVAAAAGVTTRSMSPRTARRALVALWSARDHRRTRSAGGPFRRFLQEHEIAQRIANPQWCACTTAASATSTPGLAGDGVFRARRPALAHALRSSAAKALRPHGRDRARARHRTSPPSGLLHQDLETGNDVREDGSIALIDFGCPRTQLSLSGVFDTGTVFGTPHYMSRGRATRKPSSPQRPLQPRRDLFEMLTGAAYRADVHDVAFSETRPHSCRRSC